MEKDSLRGIISQNGLCSCSDNHTLLFYATAGGHLNIVNRLLKAGAGANPQPGDTNCHHCGEGMCEPLPEVLQDMGFCTALDCAAEIGNSPILNRLLEMGACVSWQLNGCWKRCSPLSHAAENGHIHIVNRLLELDKELHSLSYSLERAIYRGQVPAVEMLLELVTTRKMHQTLPE